MSLPEKRDVLVAVKGEVYDYNNRIIPAGTRFLGILDNDGDFQQLLRNDLISVHGETFNKKYLMTVSSGEAEFEVIKELKIGEDPQSEKEEPEKESVTFSLDSKYLIAVSVDYEDILGEVLELLKNNTLLMERGKVQVVSRR